MDLMDCRRRLGKEGLIGAYKTRPLNGARNMIISSSLSREKGSPKMWWWTKAEAETPSFWRA